MCPCKLTTRVFNVSVTATAAPGTEILRGNAQRVAFTVAFSVGTDHQLTSSGTSVGDGLAFFRTQRAAAGANIQNFVRFSKEEYGDLVLGSISCFSGSGNSTVLVTETLVVTDNVK